jgi:pantetheine-phosphate adenylyltransferase
MLEKNQLIKAVSQKTDIYEGHLRGMLKEFDAYPRFYHSSDHILDLCQKILKDGHDQEQEMDLLLTAIYHDYIYDPKSKTNEADSAEIFRRHRSVFYPNLTDLRFTTIYETIIDTKGHVPRTVFSERFCYYDLSGFDADPSVILENEYKIRKEYGWADWTDYVSGKIEFLATYRETPIPKRHRAIYDGMGWLAKHVKNEKAPNIGVYAGSFNPFHVGHKNILEKAEQIFDKVIIAQGINPDKKGEANYFKNKDIAACVQSEFEDSNPVKYLNYHQYEIYATSLVEYLNGKGYNPTLIRGLRNTTDLQTEIQQSRWLQALKPDIKIVNIICDAEFEHISSSGIRAVQGFSDLKNLGDKYTV